MKIAVIHDWLITYAGAERVLEQMLHVFPSADLYSVVDFLPGENRGFLQGKTPRTTWIQSLPFAAKKYRNYLPLMPRAIESLALEEYDLILSSSHAVAKGGRKRPDQLHISYVHSPMRYAWDLREQYLRESGLSRGLKGRAARWMLDRVQNWDHRASARVDHFIANSRFIGERIRNCYQRESEVIYPPVDTEAFRFEERKEDYFVTVSRLVPYKRVDLIAEAFSRMPHLKLKIIGDGPDWEKVRAKAGPNVEMLGSLDFESLRALVAKARAFVFAAEEDFGISVVEAQASGTPVIAYGRGGALETVRPPERDRPTGLFFSTQDVQGIQASLARFEEVSGQISPAHCRENALRFSIARFREEYRACVEKRLVY